MTSIINNLPVSQQLAEWEIISRMTPREQEGYFSVLESIQSTERAIDSTKLLLQSEKEKFKLAGRQLLLFLQENPTDKQLGQFYRQHDVLVNNSRIRISTQLAKLEQECQSYKVLKASYMYHSRKMTMENCSHGCQGQFNNGNMNSSPSSPSSPSLSSISIGNKATESDCAEIIMQLVGQVNSVMKCNDSSSTNQMLRSLYHVNKMELVTLDIPDYPVNASSTLRISKADHLMYSLRKPEPKSNTVACPKNPAIGVCGIPITQKVSLCSSIKKHLSNKLFI